MKPSHTASLPTVFAKAICLTALTLLTGIAAAQGAGGRSVTQGLATKVIDSLY